MVSEMNSSIRLSDHVGLHKTWGKRFGPARQRGKRGHTESLSLLAENCEQSIL